jgi:putative copper resistance protein D
MASRAKSVADPLIVARAIQFASSITVAGAALFPAAVAGEQLRAHPEALAPIQRQLDWIVLIGLGLAVVSGGLWLLLVASKLEQSTQDADSIAWLVLTGTQFGRVSVVRSLIAGLLALLVGLRYLKPLLPTLNWVIALLGIAFVLGLAWCGHSGAGLGLSGDFQVGADAAHLVTAAIWVGGLLPLLIFISPSVPISATGRYQIVRRFSLLATWAVALLIASGIVNTWYMTDGMRRLFGTEYGSLVLAKVGLLLIMLGFASVNRFWLTPRLPVSNKAPSLLCISTGAEIALGLIVICVVAVLGQLEPAGHMHSEAMSAMGH